MESVGTGQVERIRAFITLLEDTSRSALVRDSHLSPDEAHRRLDAELAYYRELKLESHTMQDVFRRFCTSLANRGAMFNVVFGGTKGCDAQQKRYAAILSDFEPQAILKKYRGNADQLLADLAEARGLTPEQAKRQLSEPRSLFRSFGNGILEGAAYFAQFEDGPAFARFVRGWTTNAEKTAMLPEHLAKQGITGFGPALAADFLKEIGVKELGKPDIWVNRCLKAAGIIPEIASERQIQRTLWQMSQMLGDAYPPIIIDKLMFLVGSGRFEMGTPEYKCGSSFSEFERAIATSRIKSPSV